MQTQMIASYRRTAVRPDIQIKLDTAALDHDLARWFPVYPSISRTHDFTTAEYQCVFQALNIEASEVETRP